MLCWYPAYRKKGRKWLSRYTDTWRGKKRDRCANRAYLHTKVEKDGRAGVQTKILDSGQGRGAPQHEGEKVRHGSVCKTHEGKMAGGGRCRAHEDLYLFSCWMVSHPAKKPALCTAKSFMLRGPGRTRRRRYRRGARVLQDVPSRSNNSSELIVLCFEE